MVIRIDSFWHLLCSLLIRNYKTEIINILIKEVLSMSNKKMMHARGLVTSLNKNGFANVIMDRKNACSGCGSEKSNNCKSCLSGSKIQVLVLNTKNAKKGDIVPDWQPLFGSG